MKNCQPLTWKSDLWAETPRMPRSLRDLNAKGRRRYRNKRAVGPRRSPMRNSVAIASTASPLALVAAAGASVVAAGDANLALGAVAAITALAAVATAVSSSLSSPPTLPAALAPAPLSPAPLSPTPLLPAHAGTSRSRRGTPDSENENSPLGDPGEFLPSSFRQFGVPFPPARGRDIQTPPPATDPLE
jgi:hypothetical protein